MSLFITFEGGEGCGKSTQARLLYQRLSKLAIPAVLTYEPGGTPFGKRLGRWLKWSNDKEISPLTELLLFNAARAESVIKIIIPGLKDGKTVISDRYADSTTVYQGYGRGLDLEMVRYVNNAATSSLKPDLTVLLDSPIEAGLARKRLKNQDRFEREELSFHQRVRDGYLKLATSEPERWLVVDATQSKKQIAEIIWHKMSQLLSKGAD
jgi:dTMP kinase